MAVVFHNGQRPVFQIDGADHPDDVLFNRLFVRLNRRGMVLLWQLSRLDANPVGHQLSAPAGTVPNEHALPILEISQGAGSFRASMNFGIRGDHEGLHQTSPMDGVVKPRRLR